MKTNTIQGWMTAAEQKWLAEQAAKSQVVVEIGVWKGRSSVILADACPGKLYCVDHFSGTPEDITGSLAEAATADGRVTVKNTFLKNIAPWKDKVILLEGASADMAAHCPPADFVFIDADHSYEGCYRDIKAYWPIVKPGGIMGGHDISLFGVLFAVNEMFPDWKYGPDAIWWTQKD